MDEQLEEFIKKQKEVVITSYEQGKNYSNIIMMGGYAGMFAVWNFTRADLLYWQSLSVGLLMTLSVMIFVLFELYGAWFRARQTFNLMSELNKIEKLERFPVDYGREEIKRAEKLAKIWPFFFFPSLVTGVSAAIILIWSFVSGLLFR